MGEEGVGEEAVGEEAVMTSLPVVVKQTVQ